MQKYDSTSSRGGVRRERRRPPAARPSGSRLTAEEVLLRSHAARAEVEQARVFQSGLVAEADELHEQLRELHEDLREIYRQLGNLRRRFPTLPAVQRPAGFPPIVVPAQPPAGPRRTA